MLNYNYSPSHFTINISTNTNSNMENNLGQITKGKWTNAQRRIVWMLLVKAREGLKIDINPVVATAFVILQKYFRNLDEENDENDFTVDYDLLTLMTAALFTACKIKDETARPMDFIYNELSRICLNAPSQKVRLILGSRLNITHMNPNHYIVSRLCDNDYKIIARCEIDLLDASGFDIDFDLPFRYLNEILIMLYSLLPRDSMSKIYNTWLIDTCLMICSQYYLDIPPEVAAAAAVADSFQNCQSNLSFNCSQQTAQSQIQFHQHRQNSVPFAVVAPEGAPQYIVDWVRNIKQKHDDRLFELAQHAIIEERQRTIQFGR